MKRNLLILLAGVIIGSPACTKLGKIDEIAHTGARMCPILKMRSLDSTLTKFNIPLTRIVFHYNAVGNPVEIENASSRILNGFLPNFYFRYDRFNRLTDFLDIPSGFAQVYSWHRYSYRSRDIIVDSLYGFNNAALITASNPAPESFEGVTIHYLDNEGRIIKDVQTFSGVLSTTYFQYDARGNKVRNGVQYDNGVNPYLTNEVWRFIYEDYSLNNPLIEYDYFGPVIPSDYNAFGLPRMIWNDAYLFGFAFGKGAQIYYACDPPQ